MITDKHTIQRVLAGFVVATLLAVSSTTATFARDNTPGTGHEGALCYYGGVPYSEGSIVRMDNGALYKCVGGKWEFVSSSRLSPRTNLPATRSQPTAQHARTR
jgi:hypothetical protein